MKYQKEQWIKKSDGIKLRTIKDELELDTHNGTTKDDLLMMLEWIYKIGVVENLPEIVCLCGSTRFYKTFDEQNFRLTLDGKIVLSIGCNTKSDEGLKLTEDDKVRLDELHKRKIDLCDSVLVLNVDGYIGDSTKSEIAYAEKNGKPVSYLET